MSGTEGSELPTRFQLVFKHGVGRVVLSGYRACMTSCEGMVPIQYTYMHSITVIRNKRQLDLSPLSSNIFVKSKGTHHDQDCLIMPDSYSPEFFT